MPPIRIISSSNKIICFVVKGSYLTAFGQSGKAGSPGAPVLPLRPIMLVFLFFLHMPDGEIGHARGGLKVISLLPTFV